MVTKSCIGADEGEPSLRSFTVIGHVVGPVLPPHGRKVGSAVVQHLPNSQRIGGGPQLQHIVPGSSRQHTVSITPSHAQVMSDWQIGFRNVRAENEEEATWIVNTTLLPRWRVAMRLATGTDIHAHLSAVVCENEGSGDGWSPYSQSSRFTQFEQIEVLRNRDVERVIDYERSIRMDGAANEYTG